MSKVFNQLRHRWILISILTVALLLRLLHPTFAQPTLYVNGDEPPNYMGALYILANQSLIVRTAIYPPFGSYLQVPFLLLAFGLTYIIGQAHSLAELRFLLTTQPGYFLFVPRIICGVLGGFTVLLLYRIVCLFFAKNRTIPLLASLFLAFSFNHGQVSHFGRPWAPAMFFFSLTMWFTIKSIYQPKQGKKYVLLAALCAISTYGFHQVGVFAAAFFWLVRTIEKNFKSGTRFALTDRSTWMGITIIILGIGAIKLLETGNPTAQWFPSLKQFPPGYPFFKQLWELLLDSNLYYNIKQLVLLEPGILFFFLISIIISHPWRRPFTSLFAYAMFATLTIGFSFKQPRYMLPALIPLSIFSAMGFLDVYKRITTKWIQFGFIITSLIVTSFNLVMFNIIFVQKSTAVQAIEWIEKHISPDETIISAAGKWVSYTPSKDVLHIQQINNPHFFEQAQKILPKKTYPLNVRNFIYMDQFTPLDQESIAHFIDTFSLPYHYLLDIYYDPSATYLMNLDPGIFHKVASFSPLKNSYQPEFIQNMLSTVNRPALPILLWKSERIGPYIDIYENSRYRKPVEE